MEPKVGFSKRLTKINKPVARRIKKNRRLQVLKKWKLGHPYLFYRIKRLIEEYYTQLYTNKLIT